MTLCRQQTFFLQNLNYIQSVAFCQGKQGKQCLTSEIEK